MAPEKKAMPKWTKAPDGLVEKFHHLISGLSETESRKMFGFPCAFSANQMFFGVFQNSLFLRLSEEDRKSFILKYKSDLFAPMPGRPMREYVLVPIALLEEEKELQNWIDKGRKYASQLPAKVKSARKSSSKKKK
jgi:TfoX/Sxy family transcriptional regulator of competence genes